MTGKLFCLEGLDGCGKATQAKLLVTDFSARGVELKHISFPDYSEPSSALVKMYLGGGFGTDPNAVNPYAASSFFAVDRYASFHRFWKQAYRNGEMILADRYSTSNIVFHMGKLPQSEWDAFIKWVEDYEYQKLGLPAPDAVFYLDMPPEVSAKLLSERYHGDEAKKDIHERNKAYTAACRQSALYAAKKLGWHVINCAEDDNAKPVDQIHDKIMEVILKELA